MTFVDRERARSTDRLPGKTPAQCQLPIRASCTAIDRLGRERQRAWTDHREPEQFPRTDPTLVPIPAYASYNGTGDAPDAVNFTCMSPMPR